MAISTMRGLAHWFVWFFGLLCISLATPAARGGTLAKADLDKMFAPALIVGEPNAGLPVRPLFAQEGANLKLRGYVFESIDFEPVRGYAGKAINMLVAIDPAGKFLDVRVLGQC